MTEKHGREIAMCPGVAYTAMADGEPIACAGMIELWSGRAYAWAYIGEQASKHWKTVHRAVHRALSSAKWRRVEMAVDIRDPGAKNWASHLGFVFEGVARAWTTDGRDVEIWARVPCRP
jgi:hypothetical protein